MEVHALVTRLRKADAYFADRTIHAEAADALEKLEGEADQLAQEAARESARAEAAERDRAPEIPPDYLNMP